MSIEQLLKRLDIIETTASTWQESPDDVNRSEILVLRDQYLTWFTQALQVVPSEKVDTFRDAYEGGQFTSRIKAFLLEPLKPSPFYDPAANNALLSEWQYPFVQTFADSAAIQRAILYEAATSTVPVEEQLELLAERLGRLSRYLHDLQTLGLSAAESEADLQKRLLPLLRVIYSDVRREDYVSQFAGGNSRVDFLLHDEEIVIETKMTRPGLTDRRLGEELLVDWGRYPQHPNCRAIFALIFDPARHVDNPLALAHDLANAGARVPVRVLIVN